MGFVSAVPRMTIETPGVRLKSATVSSSSSTSLMRWVSNFQKRADGHLGILGTFSNLEVQDEEETATGTTATTVFCLFFF